MALLDFFLSRKKNTANIAKERLQIIVAERRAETRSRITCRSYAKISWK
ncbi:cell division topological specificity factor MinE [Klebsiella pneumoniae]|uniref:Cell division topological specificity factor MinE n=1 Tax=Klebsiella pneumoniae TaxID=573 RepID=A0A377XD13_KLEPN|nr:cell division topological specificity factor MinE [Klebsiella pneumoniae]